MSPDEVEIVEVATRALVICNDLECRGYVPDTMTFAEVAALFWPRRATKRDKQAWLRVLSPIEESNAQTQ